MNATPLKIFEQNNIIRTDQPIHKGKRDVLLSDIQKKLKLSPNEISDIVNVFHKVPRHFFIEQIYENVAYKNQAIELQAHQTISKPITVIFQTYLLNLKNTDKVLEIGTGSGFQTCILAELANQVYTIERQKVLFDQRSQYFNDQYFTTNEILQPFNLKSRFSNVEYRWGDGFKGLPAFQPYNKILITCAAPEIPKALIEQLKPHGILVAPIDIVPGKASEKQIMTRIQKLENGELKVEKFHEFKFVPMLQGKQ